MKLTNIGGATAILEHKGKRILFDPWLDDGIFYGSWYHYPPCDVRIADLGHFDYVYISHIHEDHCSAGTIKHINKDAEIILIDRQPNYVLRFLERNGFHFKKIHLVKERSPTEIAPGFLVDMLRADPAYEYNFLIDSALVLNWDNFVVYNANDCAPYPGVFDYLLSTYREIDLALLPYTGGSGYPTCYVDLADEIKEQESRRIREGALDGFVTAYEALRPKYISPFADQYVVAGSRFYLNRYLPHPSTPGAVHERMKTKGYDEHLLLLNSGQAYDFDTGSKSPRQDYRFHTNEDRDEYIRRNLTDKIYDYERFELNTAVPIERLMNMARARLWIEQTRDNYFPSCNLYVSVKDQSRLFEIDMRSPSICEVPELKNRNQPYLAIFCPASLLVLMLIGQISWNMADAALFLDYERIPNTYDPKLYAFINFLRV